MNSTRCLTTIPWRLAADAAVAARPTRSCHQVCPARTPAGVGPAEPSGCDRVLLSSGYECGEYIWAATQRRVEPYRDPDPFRARMACLVHSTGKRPVRGWRSAGARLVGTGGGCRIVPHTAPRPSITNATGKMPPLC